MWASFKTCFEFWMAPVSDESAPNSQFGAEFSSICSGTSRKKNLKQTMSGLTEMG